MKVFIPRAANMLRKMYLGPWIYGNPKWRWANEDGVSWLFGRDYYVTDILHQAEVWAGIKSRYFMDAKAVVNEYLFDFDNAIKDFKYKKFERYDGEWLHFIVDSRDGKKVWEKYDIIEGGVANDRVIDTVEAFKAGQISEEKALKNNQICILKQAVADKYFKFVRSVILK